MHTTQLYKVTATGAIQIWQITRQSASLDIVYGQVGGQMQHQWETIEVNQSGRSLPEQVELRADSRIKKQLDKGYCYTIEEAKNSIGLNASKLLKPMLARKFSDKPTNYKECFIQHKYNGHRCLITSTEEGIIAYSRNGKTINTIQHILNGLNLLPGTTLDGELYVHDMALQDAGSLIRKIQPNNDKLEFICYDLIINKPYEERLNRLLAHNLGKHIKVAPTKFGSTVKNLDEELTQSIHDGYEGLILRTNDKGYEPGKRSSSLIKLKKWLDGEFLVLDILSSKDDWAILECTTMEGRRFRVTAPGTIQEKESILTNKWLYIGSWINIEFFEWTNDMKPFHPVAKYWRS
jgi:ATP-dependent DNA ligase